MSKQILIHTTLGSKPVNSISINGIVAVHGDIHTTGYTITHIPSGYALPLGTSGKERTINMPRTFKRAGDARKVSQFMEPLLPQDGDFGVVPEDLTLEDWIALWSIMLTFMCDEGIEVLG